MSNSVEIGITIGMALKGVDALGKASSGVEALSKRINGLKANLGRLGSVEGLEGLSGKLEKMRGDFKSKIVDKIALGSAVVLPFKVGIEFEAAMKRVGALALASKSELASLEATAKKLGATTTFSAKQAAEGMQFLAMAGFKTNDTIAAMPGLLNLAAAGATDLATTSDIASNILTGFNLKATQMGRVADIMAKTMTSSNVTTQMLGDTMKYAAPFASSLGASLEEVAALSGKLGDAGIQGSMAGTTIKNMYARLAAPPDSARKELEKLGIVTKNADGSFKGMTNILGDLNTAMSGMADAKRAEILNNIFGLESVAGATVLLKQGKEGLKSYTALLENSTGVAAKIAKEQNASMGGALKQFGSALEGVQISLATLFLPTLSSLTLALSTGASWLNSFIEEHKTLATVLGGVAFGAATLSVGLSALGYVASFLGTGFIAVVKAGRTLALVTKSMIFYTKSLSIWQARNAFALALLAAKTYALTFATNAWKIAQIGLNVALLANPIGIVIASLFAIGAAVVYAYKHFDGFRAFIDTAFSGIKKLFSGFGSFISSVFTAPFSAIKSVFSGLFSFIEGKFKWLGSAVEKIKGIGSTIASFFGGGEDKSASAKRGSGQGLASPKAGLVIEQGGARPLHSIKNNNGSKNINVVFNGDFKLVGTNGKFDLESFKSQLTNAVKMALNKDRQVAMNRSILG